MKMSKLHIYRKVGKEWSKIADGDGALSQTEPFTVKILSGKVSKGTTYQIKQGQSPTGDLYNCTEGADKDEDATFEFQSHFSSIDKEFQYNAALLSLRSALLATEKTVTITIAENDLKELKGSDYKLCFAKKVGNADYNIVWQSYTKYLVNNTFSWTPQYQLFGSNLFQGNIKVRVATNVVDIGLGETSVLDSTGVLGSASTGGSSTSLNLKNEYGSIHPGVNQLSTGIDGSKVSSPIYVAVKSVQKGDIELTPVEKVLVWFEQEIETRTMFSSSRSKSIEIDLTNADTATRLYKDQIWSTP
jgi:hypothetical protein